MKYHLATDVSLTADYSCELFTTDMELYHYELLILLLSGRNHNKYSTPASNERCVPCDSEPRSTRIKSRALPAQGSKTSHAIQPILGDIKFIRHPLYNAHIQDVRVQDMSHLSCVLQG